MADISTLLDTAFGWLRNLADLPADQMRSVIELCSADELKTVMEKQFTDTLTYEQLAALEDSFRKKLDAAVVPDDPWSPWAMMFLGARMRLEEEEAAAENLADIPGDLKKQPESK